MDQKKKDDRKQSMQLNRGKRVSGEGLVPRQEDVSGEGR